MVGPPFSSTAGGRLFFLPPMEEPVDASTIAVIVLAGLFFVGMTVIMIVRNTPPREGGSGTPKKEG